MRSQDEVWARSGKDPGSAEGMVGEHLNEATITRLGSILECGNMIGHRNCRSTDTFSLAADKLK